MEQEKKIKVIDAEVFINLNFKTEYITVNEDVFNKLASDDELSDEDKINALSLIRSIVAQFTPDTFSIKMSGLKQKK